MARMALIMVLAAVGCLYALFGSWVPITEHELYGARPGMEAAPDWGWLRFVDYDEHDGELLQYRGHFSTGSSGQTVMASDVPSVTVKHAGPVPPASSGDHEAILLVNGAGRGIHEVIWLDGERTDLIPYRTIWESPPGGRP